MVRGILGEYLFQNSRLGEWCRERFGEAGGRAAYLVIFFLLSVGVVAVSIPLAVAASISPLVGVVIVVALLLLSWRFLGMSIVYGICVGFGAVFTVVGALFILIASSEPELPLIFPVTSVILGVLLLLTYRAIP